MKYDFQTICSKVRPSLLAKASQLCRNPHAAEDLVQETMLAAFTVWHTFEPAGRDPVDRARGWLHRMLVNRFIQDFRARVRHAEAVENRDADLVEATMAVEPYGPGELLNREGFVEHVDDDLKQAVAALPADYRDVILRTAWGQDDQQIATELGLDRRNVRHRLWRARRRLAELLPRAA